MSLVRRRWIRLFRPRRICLWHEAEKGTVLTVRRQGRGLNAALTVTKIKYFDNYEPLFGLKRGSPCTNQ